MLKFRKVFLISFGLLLLNHPVWGQKVDKKDNEIVEINQMSNNDEIISPVDYMNNSFLTGDVDFKTCDREDKNDCGEGENGKRLPHLAIIGVYGNVNQTYIDQKGNGNSTSLFLHGDYNIFSLSQRGKENYYEGSFLGDENEISIVQKGKGNNIEQDLSGNGMDIRIIQKGYNHEFFQTGTVNSTSPCTVIQEGNHGMSVIIDYEQP